jgi:hypothetical protein
MVEEVFTKVYDNPDRVNHLRRRPHLLAVIYFIFAISATFDRSVPTGNDAARTYFRLGAQCVNLRCLGVSNDLESVQAIALLSQFQSITTEKEQSDGAWFYGSMAVKLATKVRLRCRYAGLVNNPTTDRPAYVLNPITPYCYSAMALQTETLVKGFLHKLQRPAVEFSGRSFFRTGCGCVGAVI